MIYTRIDVEVLILLVAKMLECGVGLHLTLWNISGVSHDDHEFILYS